MSSDVPMSVPSLEPVELVLKDMRTKHSWLTKKKFSL